ncbi:pyrimidodiazepine synthase-like [Drosophila gunungcola]|uniref:pyrimidodiazepine synthase-like n=1 Tax=Drosophila gunungcola TaxID=103775 RepID=UPI0022E13963|nr:pyrimidodiazepine synthase-like [Drosophila gunungcola]
MSSTRPDLPEDGILRYFSMAFCPFSQRVHLLLAAKNIPHHKIYLTAVEDQPTLVESLIIAEYLDQQYPHPRLFPTDPLQKALDKILIERFAPVVRAVYPVLTCNANAPPDALQKFEKALDVFETELTKRGTPYFAGQTIGIVDYMIWPWFERFPSMKLNTKQRYELDAKRFEKLLKWRDLVAQDEAVQKTALDVQLHAEFQKSKTVGNPQYDIAFKGKL